MKDQEIEKLLIKQQEVQKSVANILTANFNIDEDLAQIVATDTIQQSLNIVGVKPRHKVFHLLKKYRAYIQYTLGITIGLPLVYYIGRFLLSVVLMFFIAIGSFCSSHCSKYPEVDKLPENYQFVNETYEYNGSKIQSIYNKLCLFGEGSSRGQGEACIHPKKADELNSRLRQAVEQDFNGIIYNEPNGNGEIWTIERNNYRFVVNRTKDENFK